jgi:nitrous oxidase accessory protein NosD
MKALASLVVFFVTALMLLLGCGTARAQAVRTWVSGVGDDANPCSRTAPCKTFAGAISKTAAAGEINCLDPGGFGAVTITKAITIRCEAGTAGVLVSGTNGIIVNVLAADIVQLKGLDINGLGPSAGSLAGVAMLGAGNLSIQNSIIYGFRGSSSGRGIYVNGSNNARVFIENTQIKDNLTGVYVQPQAGATTRYLSNAPFWI